MIEITVNKNIKQIPTDSALSQLLEELSILNKKGIAVALNRQIISANQWNSQGLKEGDQVTIITATQGG